MTSPEVQVSEQLLHASVLSMIEFDEDIFAAGNCFDYDRHPKQKGLFCPFGHRLSPPSEGVALVKNLADEYHYLDNGSEWFYIARKNAEAIIERNEQHVKGKLPIHTCHRTSVSLVLVGGLEFNYRASTMTMERISSNSVTGKRRSKRGGGG